MLEQAPSIEDAFAHKECGVKKPVKRTFQPSWFTRWPWLHYEEESDTVFCFTCSTVEREGKLKCSSKDKVFLTKVFTNCKDATDCFQRHEKSKCHMDAVQVMIVLPKTTRDVGEINSAMRTLEKSQNRQILVKIVQNITFLGKQGLTMRGHNITLYICWSFKNVMTHGYTNG